jgi:hypothetical protein
LTAARRVSRALAGGMGFHIALTTQTIATTHSNGAEAVIVAGKCSLSGDWGESFDRIGDSLGEFAGLVWGSLRDLLLVKLGSIGGVGDFVRF